MLRQEADSAPGQGYCEGEGGAGGGAGAGSRAGYSDETLELAARRNKPERLEDGGKNQVRKLVTSSGVTQCAGWSGDQTIKLHGCG